MRSYRIITRTFVSLCLLVVSAQAPAQQSRDGLNAVNPAHAYELCRKLASPDFAGRLTGDPGYTAAARWAADLFGEWGLKPLDARHGYLQPFPTQYTVVESAAMTLVGSEGAPEVRFEAGRDFLPLLFADSVDATGEAVFAGWGISAPELNYDDYSGLDLRGKFVLCFRGVPDPADARYTEHDQHRTRMNVAKERGALGLVYLYNEPIANPNGDWISGFAPAVIGEKAADLILKDRGFQSAVLRSDLTRYKRPLSFSTGKRIKLALKVRHVPNGRGYNVAGMIEGSDPALRREYVVVGAHADHCGSHMGLLFPGAEDNASGSAAVMEIARIFARSPVKPRRSIVIALFGGEEAGLKGSEYFTANLLVPGGTPVAMLNLDMVGSGDGMNCAYSGKEPTLETAVRDADKHIGIVRSMRPIRGVGVRGSDYAPFFARGIPCVSFASNGPHLAYHQTGDTIYRINPDMLADAARLGFAVAHALASGAEP
jgi:hypothetical protein